MTIRLKNLIKKNKSGIFLHDIYDLFGVNEKRRICEIKNIIHGFGLIRIKKRMHKNRLDQKIFWIEKQSNSIFLKDIMQKEE